MSWKSRTSVRKHSAVRSVVTVPTNQTRQTALCLCHAARVGQPFPFRALPFSCGLPIHMVPGYGHLKSSPMPTGKLNPVALPAPDGELRKSRPLALTRTQPRLSPASVQCTEARSCASRQLLDSGSFPFAARVSHMYKAIKIDLNLSDIFTAPPLSTAEKIYRRNARRCQRRCHVSAVYWRNFRRSSITPPG